MNPSPSVNREEVIVKAKMITGLGDLGESRNSSHAFIQRIVKSYFHRFKEMEIFLDCNFIVKYSRVQPTRSGG